MTFIKIKSQEEFIDNIREGESFVMISKDNCGFCERARPIFEELSKDSKIKYIEAKKDKIPDILNAFQVRMYPTFAKIKDGKVQDLTSGDSSREVIEKFVKNNS